MPNRYIGAAQQGSWYAGFGAPSSALGTDGDLYLNLTNGQGYYRSGGSWATQTIGTGGGGGSTSPLTTKGDLWGFSTVDARLPVGTNGQRLVADSAEALGVKWLSGTSLVVVSTAYASTVTLDLSSYSAYDIVIHLVGTLTGPITYNITNGFDGQIVRARFRQDSTGGRVLAHGANLRGSASTPLPLLSVGPSALDRLGFEWCAADSKADLVAINKSYT